MEGGTLAAGEGEGAAGPGKSTQSVVGWGPRGVNDCGKRTWSQYVCPVSAS